MSARQRFPESSGANIAIPDEEDEAPPVAVVPLTAEEWNRVLKGEHKFRILVSVAQQDWAGNRAVRCGTCAHAGDDGGDPWRAWCIAHRCMVSNTFTKLCPAYRPN